MVFRTADFPGYGDESPLGFSGQLQALTGLLDGGIDPARCAQPHSDDDDALPFLPWINARQTFCAQPRLVEFRSGTGIRYLSHYAQGPGPVVDYQVFYTFQGLTHDRQFYISALFPVQTGIFPTEPPACPRCGDADYDPFAEWMAALSEQLTGLNAQPEAEFGPALSVLDELVGSIEIRP